MKSFEAGVGSAEASVRRRHRAWLDQAKARIDLCALVRDIAAAADFEAQGRSRSVRIVACEECEVNSVLELLRSAVENVVRNAVHYTAEGTAVEVSLHHDDDAGDTGMLWSAYATTGRACPKRR